MEEKKKQIVDLACRLLRKKSSPLRQGLDAVSGLAGDGSQRVFFRLRFDDDTAVVAVLPGSRDTDRMAEARSAWLIGSHLYRTGVPVPEPLAYDEESGTILVEDLGDLRLHDSLREIPAVDDAELLRRYTDAVRELARMQVLGGRGFDVSWCWQTPAYDRELMLARESGYFLEAMCRGLLALDADTPGLRREFADIADHAAAAPSHFFLHRDFQSRNLMLKDGRLRIIDFQGGRLGPLAYDLASLLIDPYVCLPGSVQETLIEEYLRALQRHTPYDSGQFRREYFYLALQRNLQILGAFAFLGGKMGKTFFLPYIHPALNTLNALLAQEGQGRYPVLSQLVHTCQEQIQRYGL